MMEKELYEATYNEILIKNEEMQIKLAYLRSAFAVYFGNFAYEYLLAYFGDAVDKENYCITRKEKAEYSEWKPFLLCALKDETNKERVEAVNRYWTEHPEEFFKALKTYVDGGILRESAEVNLTTAAINAYEDEPERCFFELVQNADDCKYSEGSERKLRIRPLADANGICISYDEQGMRYDDVIALCSLNETNKQEQEDKIGEKGQGFKTVFKIANKVEVTSGGYSFCFFCEETPARDGVKIRTEQMALSNACERGTRLVLYLKSAKEEVMKRLFSLFGMGEEDKSYRQLFCNCPVFFTNQICELELETVDGNRYCLKNDREAATVKYMVNDECVREVPYILYSENLLFSEAACKERYGGNVTGTKEKRVSIVVPDFQRNRELITGITEGCFYTFLPTSEKIRVPMNVHAPAFLNKERTGLYITREGNSYGMGKWNETIIDWLFAVTGENCGIEGLFRSLQSKGQEYDGSWWYLIPSGSLFDGSSVLQGWLKNHREEQGKRWDAVYKRLELFCRTDGGGYVTAEHAMMLLPAMDALGLSEVYAKVLREEYGFSGKYHVCRPEVPEASFEKQLQLLGYEEPQLPSEKNNDDEKTELFHRIFDAIDKSGYGEEQWKWLGSIFNGSDLFPTNSGRYLLPDNRKCLRLIPVVIQIDRKNEVRYRALSEKGKSTKDVWLWYKEGFVPLSDADGYFKMLPFGKEEEWFPAHSGTELGDLTEEAFKKLLEKVDTAEQFRDFMILYMRNQPEGQYEEEEWFDYTKKLIDAEDEKHCLAGDIMKKISNIPLEKEDGYA